MLWKLTERCSLGCTHCINDSKPDGDHMRMETLLDCMQWAANTHLLNFMVLSGGEPTEHPEWEKVADTILDVLETVPGPHMVCVATNGFWLLDHQEWALDFVIRTKRSGRVDWTFQISTDRRYYPRRIDSTKRLWRQDGFVFIDDCVESLYPLGRARNMKCNRILPQCFNIRSICRQLNDRGKLNSFSEAVKILEMGHKFCTPSINIHGQLHLGESDLCTPLCGIGEDPLEYIPTFRCDRCNHLVQNIPEELSQFFSTWR